MSFLKCLITVVFVSSLLVGCTSGTSTCASTGTAEAQAVDSVQQPAAAPTPANAEPTEVAAEVGSCPPTAGCPCQAQGQWDDTETRVN